MVLASSNATFALNSGRFLRIVSTALLESGDSEAKPRISSDLVACVAISATEMIGGGGGTEGL